VTIFNKKLIILFLSISYNLLFSIDIYKYLSTTDADLLKDFFSINIGIMRLKNSGNLNLIDPIDSENVTNTIKTTLDLVTYGKMDKKSALNKSYNILKQKDKNILDSKEQEIFEKKIFFMDEENSTLIEIFKIMNRNATFKNIAKLWFENFNNPVYKINVLKPFDRILKDNKTICEQNKYDNKYPIDLLFYGEIERIEQTNIINLYIYSYHLDRNIAEITIVSDSENLMENVRKKLKSIFTKIFLVNYATLEINTVTNTSDATGDVTGDNISKNQVDTRIYLDDNYLGKNRVLLEFTVPGNYVLKLTKEGYNDYYENIKISDFENKKLNVSVTSQKEMQVVNFYIEPFGTKIFINSVYQGKTPFKKVLPVGNYVIYAKNELFEDLRYVLSIREIKNEDMNVIYHLKSKNIDTQFKVKRTLYYVAFWNFTFSLTAMIPTVIFAYDYFYKFSYAQTNYNLKMGITQETAHLQYVYTEEGKILEATYKTLYGFAAFMISYTVLSLGWLFYALADYLFTLEKKDFIPILDFYNGEKGDISILFGVDIKLDKR